MALQAENGRGVYVQPLRRGQRLGGIRSEHAAQFDGWVVGMIYGLGGDEIAVGATIPEAVDAALRILGGEGGASD